MQRWEYKIVSLVDGTYTDTLNAYGRAGWELVAVAPDVHEVHPAKEEGSGGGLPVPMPRALGAIEQAGRRLTKSTAGDADEQQHGVVTTLLWILRRPLPDDDGDFEFDS
jgi:hypothetical protein